MEETDHDVPTKILEVPNGRFTRFEQISEEYEMRRERSAVAAAHHKFPVMFWFPVISTGRFLAEILRIRQPRPPSSPY